MDAGSPGCALPPAGRDGQGTGSTGSTRRGQQGAREGSSAACTMAGGGASVWGAGDRLTVPTPRKEPQILPLRGAECCGCAAGTSPAAARRDGAPGRDNPAAVSVIIPRVNGVSLFLSVLLRDEKAGGKSVEKAMEQPASWRAAVKRGRAAPSRQFSAL